MFVNPLLKFYTEHIINLFIFFLPVLIGLKRYASLDKASKILLYYAISSFVGELIALYASIRYKNNLGVYNVASLVTITLICFYFNECIERLKEHNGGYKFLVCNVTAWLISNFVIHSFFSINSSFLAYQGFLAIGLAIYSMENLVTQKSQSFFNLRSSPHFWFASILLVYWCLTIMQWVVYPYFTNKTAGFQYLDLSLIIINMLINVLLAAVFYMYPKLKQQDDI